MKMNGIESKIKRAEELRIDLLAEVNKFWASLKITCQILDSRPHYFASVQPEVPARVSLILGDVIHNLRSALDHIAYTEYKRAGLNLRKEYKVAFPVYDSKELFESQVEENKEISGEFFTKISEIGPYKENSPLLWRLHKLDIVDKHRTLLVSVPRNTGVDIVQDFKKMGFDFPSEFHHYIKPAQSNLMDDNLVFVGGSGVECDNERKFIFDLHIYEEQLGLDEPVGNLLESFFVEVDRVKEIFLNE